MLASRSPPAQKAITRRQADSTPVGIFSPPINTGAVQRGPNFTKNLTIISKGYTNVIIPPDCVLYTSNLKVISPAPTKDVTDVKILSHIQNITDILNNLFVDLSVVHGQNMTKLLTDYATLRSESIDINKEQRKILDI